MGIGERLRLVRESQKCGMREWGKTVGFGVSSLSRWEHGAVAPAAEYLQALCAVGVNGHWLLTGQGDMWGEGGASPTAQWLRRVGLPNIADASPELAAVVAMAKSGGVSVARLMKEMGLTRQDADSLLTAATAGLHLKRIRGGRYVLAQNVIVDKTTSAALALVEHLPDVLRPINDGATAGMRYGKVRVVPGSNVEFWTRLAAQIDMLFTEEPPDGDELQYSIVVSINRGKVDP